MKVRDSAAGKTGKCIDCGDPVPIPVADEDEVFDAEQFGDEAEIQFEGRTAPSPTKLSSSGANRRPCPMCGEMILAGAAKCRYCGEVFDETLRRAPGHEQVDSEMIRRFRREVHALGGFWIFVGALFFLAGLGAGELEDRFVDVDTVRAIAFAIGFSMAFIGIMACMKQLWAIYTGLVASYFLLLVSVLGLAVCPLIIVIVVLVQAHRTIGWANRMRRAGIPLTALP
jgi:hypothetical protein